VCVCVLCVCGVCVCVWCVCVWCVCVCVVCVCVVCVCVCGVCVWVVCVCVVCVCVCVCVGGFVWLMNTWYLYYCQPNYITWYILIIVQRDATQSSLFIILQVHSRYLGRQPHSSSGVHKTVTTASGTPLLWLKPETCRVNLQNNK